MVKSKKKKSAADWMTHHTIHIAIFAVFVGFLIGLYASFFFLDSDWKPGILYEDEHSHDHDAGSDSDHAHFDDSHDHDAHDHSAHGVYEIAGSIAPTIQLTASPDTTSGYNLHLVTTDFTFTPENIAQGKTLGEGHAHLYVDGEKVARIYSEYYHLDNLKPGTYEVMVTLNTDDHFDYAVNGEVISDVITLTVE